MYHKALRKKFLILLWLFISYKIFWEMTLRKSLPMIFHLISKAQANTRP